MYRNVRKAALIVALLGLVPGFRMVEPAKNLVWLPSGLIAENIALASDEALKPDKSALIGNWVGQVKTKSGDLVSVKIRVYKKGDGFVGLEMIYGGKRSCTLDGEYAGELNGAYRFSLTSRNGGYCDKLGQISMSIDSDTRISYVVTNTNGQEVERGSVNK
ncbi:MAG: hypothetical protein HGA72_07945 [Chlorobiaceae bacterium]|jgi:hypothetical protein|nr:hypothetical protein [Chlorobiaceae bacterium]